jgi:hypothetical protein
MPESSSNAGAQPPAKERGSSALENMPNPHGQTEIPVENTRNEDSADTVMLGFRVPKETKRQFHAACVSQGSDMTTVLLDFVVEYVKKNKVLLLLLLPLLTVGAAGQVIDTDGPSLSAVNPLYSVEAGPRLKEVLAPLQPPSSSAKPTAPLPSENVVQVAPKIYSIDGLSLQVTDKIKRLQVQLTPTDYIQVDVPIFAYVVREKSTAASPEDIAFLEDLYEKVATAASFTTGANDRFHAILQDLKLYTDKKKKATGTP